MQVVCGGDGYLSLVKGPQGCVLGPGWSSGLGAVGLLPRNCLTLDNTFHLWAKKLDGILCKSLQTHPPCSFRIGRFNHCSRCTYLFSNPDAAEQVSGVKLLILQLYVRFHPGSRILLKKRKCLQFSNLQYSVPSSLLRPPCSWSFLCIPVIQPPCHPCVGNACPREGLVCKWRVQNRQPVGGFIEETALCLAAVHLFSSFDGTGCRGRVLRRQPLGALMRLKSLLSAGGDLLVLWASLVAQMVKNLPTMQETWVQTLGWEDPMEKGMATQSSILAWRIPWTEEPGRLQFKWLQRVG